MIGFGRKFLLIQATLIFFVIVFYALLASTDLPICIYFGVAVVVFVVELSLAVYCINRRILAERAKIINKAWELVLPIWEANAAIKERTKQSLAMLEDTVKLVHEKDRALTNELNQIQDHILKDAQDAEDSFSLIKAKVEEISEEVRIIKQFSVETAVQRDFIGFEDLDRS